MNNDFGDDPARVLAAIVESSDDAILAVDLDGVIRTWNRGATRLFGYAAEEAIGRPLSLLMPENREGEMGERRRQIRAGTRIDREEAVRKAKDGRQLHVSVNLSPLRGPDGTLVGSSIIAHDVSEQRRVERALRSSEAHWRSIIRSAVDGIIVIDAGGLIESWNPAAEWLFGYAEAEVVGQNVNILMPSPYREEHDGYIRNYLETGLRKIIGIGREVTGRRKDGTTFPVHLAVGEMTIEGQRKFTGIVHDLTDRVRMESRLREQSALTKLGEMAAVVAHEVKNPLTGIRGALQVIGGRLPAESKDGAVVKEIIARLDALNDLMKDMLLFARPPRPRLGPVELGLLLKSVADLVRDAPAMARLPIEVSAATPEFSSDAEMLKIVIQNLILNSAHAMHGHGLVRLSGTTDAE